MNGLDKNPDREQVLAELGSVLASPYFKKKKRLQQILKYLVDLKLDGAEATEYSIALDVYERPNFDADVDSVVRVAAGDIRKLLGDYYKNEGRSNSFRIELPRETYTPVFSLQPQPPPILSTPQLPTPASGGPMRRPFWRRQLFVAGAIFISGAILAGYLWFGHNCRCGGSISIISPTEGTAVRQKEIVQGTKEPKGWFCRCKDYVIVEAVEVGQWYVEGRLMEGTQWSVTADFGEFDTRPGTRFSVFVLSTTEDLPRGALFQSPALIATGKKSAVVNVIRKGP